MSFNKLGKVAGVNLTDYTWQASDFDLLQAYFLNYLTEHAASRFKTSGLIYGGALSVSSGLVVSVSKLLANLSSQLVTMDVATIGLSAADPTNPRVDRIELGIALTNNTNVLDISGNTEVFDQVWVATLYVNPGTPGATPVANATTANRISLGLVTVNASQTLLTSTSFDQSEFATDIARQADPSEQTALLSNNISSFTTIQGLRLSSAITKSATIKGYVYLSTASAEAYFDVTIKARFKPIANAWTADVLIEGPDVGVIEGMDFQIDPTTGKIQYKTPNISGTGFAGVFKYRSQALS